MTEPISDEHLPGTIAVSPAMREVLREARILAGNAHVNVVLVTGETGTGKEHVARALHDLSPTRARKPFVSATCNEFPATLLESELFGHERGAFTGADRPHIGLFERAGDGTLFLDEIGELPLDRQPALLRALERREFRRVGGDRVIRIEARLVFATNRDLAGMVALELFRLDLCTRFTFQIAVPPLRERREDIVPLARHFCARRDGTPDQLTPAALQALQEHGWPGNVRELKNCVERLVVLAEGKTIGPDDVQRHLGTRRQSSHVTTGVHASRPRRTLGPAGKGARARTLELAASLEDCRCAADIEAKLEPLRGQNPPDWLRWLRQENFHPTPPAAGGALTRTECQALAARLWAHAEASRTSVQVAFSRQLGRYLGSPEAEATTASVASSLPPPASAPRATSHGGAWHDLAASVRHARACFDALAALTGRGEHVAEAVEQLNQALQRLEEATQSLGDQREAVWER